MSADWYIFTSMDFEPEGSGDGVGECCWLRGNDTARLRVCRMRGRGVSEGGGGVVRKWHGGVAWCGVVCGVT